MPLRVAIIGCGKIADGHVEEIRKMPTAARVVAVADRELLMAEQLAVRYGVARHYDDVDRLLAEEKPDVVHVTTPPEAHLALAVRAMDAGAHVFVEKPLTPSWADSKRLVDHAVASGKKLTIGHTYVFDPPALAMRELLAEGVLGEPVHVEAHYGYDLASPFGRAILAEGGHWVHRLPGKLFHNNLDHLLTKLVEFLDDDGLTIHATGWRRRPASFGDARDDMLDELRVSLVTKTVSAFGTFSSHIQPVAHVARIYGTKNTLVVDYAKRSVTLEPRARLPGAIGRLGPAFNQGLEYLREGARNVARFARADFHYFSGLGRLLALFYESIRTDGPPPIAYREMLRVAAISDEIFRQVPQRRAS